MGDILVRKMPDELIRRIKSEAALQGVTMRDFIVDSLEKTIEKIDASPKKKPSTASRKS
jgi:hypothetical protein